MTTDQRNLWRRIASFDIDGGPAELTFAKRLARENGWAEPFAERVVHEYKKFVFLCMTAGHKCTPSDQVDQAWHLHMIYTESYWTRFCGEVLPRPLHHGPTTGGNIEDDKFANWYERTKEAYFTAFGEEPPVDIWPPSQVRFAKGAAWKRVDTFRYLLVDRRRVGSRVMSAAAAVFAFVMAGCGLMAADDPTGFVHLMIAIAVGAIAIIIYGAFAGWFSGGGKSGSSGCGGSCAGSTGCGGDSSGCGGGGCGGGGCGGGGCSC
jgi:hypothetical protein